jgi:hypothetical protein
MEVLDLIHLKTAFPVCFPTDFLVLSRNTPEENPYDFEALIDTERFRNIKWTGVDHLLLKRCYDIPYLFSPVAFHYYFPSFIVCSLKNFDDVELLVSLTIRFFHFPENEEWMDWRKKRFDLFDAKQWQMILQWLDWIELEHDDTIDSADIARAREGITKWAEPYASR